MLPGKIIVRDNHGLHLRPADNIVEACRGFDGNVTICKGCNKATCSSISALLYLDVDSGSEVEILAQGMDEVIATNNIAEFFESVSVTAEESHGIAA